MRRTAPLAIRVDERPDRRANHAPPEVTLEYLLSFAHRWPTLQLAPWSRKTLVLEEWYVKSRALRVILAPDTTKPGLDVATSTGRIVPFN